ncbi:MAG: hypothetical protein ACP5T0_11475 [Verrucomicrobiia bacterium]
MKKIVLLLISLGLIGACGFGLFQLYKLSRAEKAAEGSEEKPVESRQFVTTNSAGQIVVKLNDEEQKKFGIQTTNLSEIVKENQFYAFGSVLDVSPLVGYLTDLKTAHINLGLAKRTFARMKTLYETGKNAPLKDVENAEAEVIKQDETIRGILNKIAIQWGEEIAANKDIESFLRQFIEHKQCLIRVDLLPGQSLENPPKSVKISLVNEEKNSYEGQYFATPKVVEAGNISRSFIYLVKDSSLPVGMKVKAMFDLGLKIKGLFLPESATVRASGSLWVYKKSNPDEFLRVHIKPESPVDGGWIITDSVKPSDLIVVKGAQMLLSEELKSQIRLVE